MAEQVAIITGAGGGIGRATAIALSKQGYAIALVGRTPATLDEAARDVNESLVIVADVSRVESADLIVNRTLSQLGRIDVLINNAGLAPALSIEQTTPQIWRQVMDTNLSGPFYLCRAVWPIFRKQGGGVVVNISSMVVKDPFPGFAAYGAAKAGLNNLGLTLAREGEPIGVRVYTVAPGAVETPMLRKLFSPQQIPTEQTASPQEVAKVIADCVAGAGQYSASQTIWLSEQ